MKPTKRGNKSSRSLSCKRLAASIGIVAADAPQFRQPPPHKRRLWCPLRVACRKVSRTLYLWENPTPLKLPSATSILQGFSDRQPFGGMFIWLGGLSLPETLRVQAFRSVELILTAFPRPLFAGRFWYLFTTFSMNRAGWYKPLPPRFSAFTDGENHWKMDVFKTLLRLIFLLPGVTVILIPSWQA